MKYFDHLDKEPLMATKGQPVEQVYDCITLKGARVEQVAENEVNIFLPSVQISLAAIKSIRGVISEEQDLDNKAQEDLMDRLMGEWERFSLERALFSLIQR